MVERCLLWCGEIMVDRKKVGEKLEEIKYLSPKEAKPIFDKLYNDKSWSDEEYNDLSGMFALMSMLLECKRCGHSWMPRKQNEQLKITKPKVCPKCNSPYWDKPRGWYQKPKNPGVII